VRTQLPREATIFWVGIGDYTAGRGLTITPLSVSKTKVKVEEHGPQSQK